MITPTSLRPAPTPRQREALDAIERLTNAAGYPPTIREMQRALRCSTRGVHDLLVRMRLLGLVAWEPHKSRTLRVVAP